MAWLRGAAERIASQGKRRRNGRQSCGDNRDMKVHKKITKSRSLPENDGLDEHSDEDYPKSRKQILRRETEIGQAVSSDESSIYD